MVKTKWHCLAIDACNTPRVTRIGHYYFLLSNKANIGGAARKLILFVEPAFVALSHQLGDDFLEFLLADVGLHDEVHLIERLHQRLLVFLLFELPVQVQLEREVLLDVLRHLRTAVTVQHCKQVVSLLGEIIDVNAGILHV